MSGLGDALKQAEHEAFDKVRDKLERVHPTNRRHETPVQMKLTVGDLEALLNFYRRHN